MRPKTMTIGSNADTAILSAIKELRQKRHGTEERQPCPYGQRNVILDKAHHGTQLYRGNAEMTSPL